ncbi:16S rRNA (cytidine(1402)-2'-O)-methyltransferase [Nitratidesulfovibrio vulgaris]|uniref:16S rRNA (cytidine(1402)-2'-O)-methyltransferase n=1 Tax=Nitratidesulfovibrio vulgaris TaxID=881 RepID=UPI002300BD55|nr:16S rRNA (cytidine(1402)-2'-O)-methyltransferase [Nitratidesulfovibrio vulgaris]WCB47483.1 16S rRNA (cytidine(1402)-2'-O)-methyltransferase [Nitratidesulfovibrio vulgaris]
MPSTSPKLWVVATPLGNPGDLSPRAREVLAAVDVVLAEDTRRTGLLFQKCGVTARRFISFHDHNEDGRIPELLTMLQSGTTAALVSDAGMPLFADPGYRLVRACRDAGVHVSVVPGPSAPLTALAASGIAPLPFTFLGFPPRKASEQEKFFAPFTTIATTLVFFERKDRLAETLAVAHGVLGHRELCVARELTKTHEEFIYGRLECHTAIPDDLLGEITVVIGPPEEASVSPREQVLAIIEEERADGGRTKDVAKRVQLRVRGWSVKDVYQLMQE